MKDSGRMRWVGVLLIGWVSYLVGEAKAFDAQEFSPAVDPEGYFSVYSSRTAPKGRFHLGIWYNFADEPVEDIVDHVHTIDLVGSYSLLDWLELGIDAPFSDMKSGVAGTRSDTGPDNIRLIAKAQVLRERWKGLGFAVVPFVDLPSGDPERLTSSGEIEGGVIGVTDYVYQRFRASLNVGYKINQEGDFSVGELNDGSDELLYGLGVGLLAFKDQPMLFGFVDNVEVLAELFGSTEASDPYYEEFATPLEMLGGARFYSKSGLYFTLGIGKSVTKSINGAGMRIVGGIGYMPPAPPPPPPAPPPAPPPPQEKVVVTEEQIITLEPIYFDFDKSTIKPVSYPVLDQVAQVMRDRPTVIVRVEGHTDSVGSDKYNQRLSERRAHAVVKYLIGKGIESNRLQAAGFGESRPIAPNETPEGRAKNRRTEFHIVTQGR
jgi:outer membrane protein OmpA-like peptidoglycan-associated protein